MKAIAFYREKTGMTGQAGVIQAVKSEMELVMETLQLGTWDGQGEKDQQKDSRAVGRLQTG